MTETTTQATLSDFFETMRSAGAGELRSASWEAFELKGLPNRRVESWHYTDLKQALRSVAPLSRGTPAAAPERLFDAARLSVVNGAFRADLSDLAALPPGVDVCSLREALTDGDAEIIAALAPACEDAVVALNAALMQDGVVLRLAPGVEIARPIEIATIVAGEAQSCFTRSLVIAGAGAKATIIETAVGQGAGAQENQALVFALHAGAEIDHVGCVKAAAEDAVRVHSLLATLDAKAALNSFVLIEGGGLLRRQNFARLQGAHARLAFNGASLLRGRAHADTTLVVVHAKPHGQSREKFRAIVDESATGVFQGKVIVEPHAQKTDGAMQSKALLLSDAAAMNNKPELEIFADDVTCGHGATCGRLDRDHLFYLQARGLPRRDAEALLIEGFANEAMSEVADDRLRDALTARVHRWLAERGAQP